MGFFDSLLNTGKTVLSNIENAGIKVLDYNQALFAHPIEFIKSPTQAVADTQASTPLGNAIHIVANTATAVGAITGVGALSGSIVEGTLGATLAKGSATVASSILSNPVKSIAALGIGTILTGAISGSPKVATAVTNIPNSLSNYGTNIGEFTQNPNVSNALNIIKENPILSALTAGTAAYGLNAIGNTVATIANTRATNKNSSATLADTSSPVIQDNTPAPVPTVKAKKKATKKKAKPKKKVTKKKTVKKKTKKKSIKRSKPKK